MKKSHIKRIFVILVVILFFVGLYVYFRGGAYNYVALSDNDYVTVNDWTVENDGREVTLPLNFSYDEYNEITLAKKLDGIREFEDTPYLMLPSRYFNYSVYLDDEQIYAFEEPKDGFSASSGYQLRIIKLGGDFSDRVLKLKITPALGNAIKYKIEAPKIGSRSDMLWSLIKKEIFSVVIASVIILLGIILLLSCFLMGRQIQTDKLFFIGILSVMCGIYIICQNQMIHLMVANSYLIYYAKYMSLSIIPLIVSIFAGINVYGRIKKFYECMSVLFVINIAAQNIMNFVFKLDFKLMLYITHILIIMLGAIIFATMIACRKDKNVQLMLLSLMLPVVGAIADLVMMYVGAHSNVVYYFSIGLYIFIAMQAFSICRQYIKYKNELMRAETYEKLAFTDGLTGLYNRLSFENDINEKTSSGSTACISIDINNLKVINDTRGHGAGDILIRAMGEILESAAGSRGKIYRIGGDEFIVIVKNTDEAEVRAILDKIQSCRAAYNAQSEMPVEFAVGVSFAQTDDSSYEKVVARADKEMYDNKREMKSIAMAGMN